MRRRSRRGSVVEVTLLALLITVLSAAPALAHVEISPARVAPDTFGTFTLQVPNEHPSEDAVGLDVALPKGFLLESAEAVPGWTTTVDARPDGTPVAVHWRGGHLPPHTFGQFSITGRVSKRPGALRFPAVQRYETSTESWNGSEASQHPAPTLVVSRAAAAATSGSAVPQVPLAAQPRQVGQGGTDSLARSRADLALMLALAALVAMSGLVALTVLRRRPAVERSGGAAKPVVDPTEPVAPPRRPRKAKRRS